MPGALWSKENGLGCGVADGSSVICFSLLPMVELSGFPVISYKTHSLEWHDFTARRNYSNAHFLNIDLRSRHIMFCHAHFLSDKTANSSLALLDSHASGLFPFSKHGWMLESSRMGSSAKFVQIMENSVPDAPPSTCSCRRVSKLWLMAMLANCQALC